jgi:uncharacterized membrane protein YedE/YeeE
MEDFITPLTGGLLIGLSSLVMLAALGRITGISGMFGGAITRAPRSAFRWAFLLGLIAGPVIYHSQSGIPLPAAPAGGGTLAVISGLLVGFGARFGGGCTSGHGICGIGRLSPRSIAATATFMTTGMLTVYLIRTFIAA